MLRRVLQEQVASDALLMPDQNLQAVFVDDVATSLAGRRVPKAMRAVLFGLPLVFSILLAGILAAAFRSDGQISVSETVLIALMVILSGWEAVSSANAVIGLVAVQQPHPTPSALGLNIAILATIRDENASDVITGKVNLLRSCQNDSRHGFALHILSDSSSPAQVAAERQLVRAAFPLPVFHHHRAVNTDFKSGNIRSWIGKQGAAYDAFIILDADSELAPGAAISLADALAADPACGLIQTVPMVMPGHTRWQHMQSVATSVYGALQGQGLAAWMGDEANYFGHNAIIRTKAFAACAGLPHISGRGLWNGTILSHDFVEAALLRRAGWAVRILPTVVQSFEQAPVDVVAHLRRDARWCLGNFQHSRVVRTSGLHPISRFHLISGIFTYLSSAVWLATLVLWALHDSARTGVGGTLAAAAFTMIGANLLLPRILGVLHAMQRTPSPKWAMVKAVVTETLLSSLLAPSLMLQRVKIIASVFANRKPRWMPFDSSHRSLVDYFVFHAIEVLTGLGLLACIERGFLTLWFLPLAICLALTPLLSWFVAQPSPLEAHGKLNGTSGL